MASGFSRGQRRVLTAFVDALLPGEVGVAAPEAESAHREDRRGVRGAAGHRVDRRLRPPPRGVRPLRAAGVGATDAVRVAHRDERVRYLRAWDESRLYLRRAMLLLLKTVVTMVYGSLPGAARDPATRPATSSPASSPRWRRDRRRLGRSAARRRARGRGDGRSGCGRRAARGDARRAGLLGGAARGPPGLEAGTQPQARRHVPAHVCRDQGLTSTLGFPGVPLPLAAPSAAPPRWTRGRCFAHPTRCCTAGAASSGSRASRPTIFPPTTSASSAISTCSRSSRTCGARTRT